MSQGKLKIHSENILPIIKKWLYSEKDIFLRELVSNACDALSKLKILRDKGEVTFQDDELKIDISIDATKKTLQITDTGIGMLEEEVEKYIAQLAFSGAEEFISKYQTNSSSDQIIGHFGLGFYSSFMVSKTVEIDTLSYKEDATAAFWSCDGSSDYTLEKSNYATRGTSITLHIDKDNEEYLEEAKIREILEKFCLFLPFPIFLNGKKVNDHFPLWIKPASECTDEEYKEFYRTLYPLEADPIFWVHLNVDYPFNLKGILYFPKISKRFDYQKSHLQLYCNRVFVSDNCKDLVPDHLMILRGVLDSPDIPLNVSRSYLQVDRTVKQLGSHISKKIADKLLSLYTQDQEKFFSLWPDLEVVIKLGILQDDKFYEKAKEFLVWKSTSGSYTTLKNYLDRHQNNLPSKVYYTFDENFSSQFLDMYKAKGIEVLLADAYLDTALFSFLESKEAPVKFHRIDSALDPSLLDKSKEKSLLDENGRSEAIRISECFRKLLNIPEFEVQAESLASNNIPAFVMLDEHARRMRDYFSYSKQDAKHPFMGKKTLVLNTNNSLVNAIFALSKQDETLSKTLSQHVLDLALLQQKELDPEAMGLFVSRTSQLLEALTGKIVTA